MNTRSLALVLLWILILNSDDSFSCTPGPGYYFAAPSYFDPDHMHSHSWDYGSGNQRHFEALLRQYITLEHRIAGQQDTAARETSKLVEPEAYSAYEEAVALFNEREFRKAHERFVMLKNSLSSRQVPPRDQGSGYQSWVREACTYMNARCWLTRAQREWDGYSKPCGLVDSLMLRAADSCYRVYLDEYPNGLYVSSAKDIRRKIYFLSCQLPLLNQELKQMLTSELLEQHTEERDSAVNIELVNEFYDYFTGRIDFTCDSPWLLVFAWIENQAPTQADIKALEAREQEFSAYPGLFSYLRALGSYRIGSYRELIEKTQEPLMTTRPICMNTQLLRARSFGRIGNDSAALNVLLSMHRVSSEDAVEVEMALHKLRTGSGIWLFTDKCPISSERNLRAIACACLSDHELELGYNRSSTPRSKRELLADELATRYLLSRRFKKLHQLLLVREIASLKPIKEQIAELSVNPDNAQALADVGEFLYNRRSLMNLYRIKPDSTRYVNLIAPELMSCAPCRESSERLLSYAPPMWFFTRAVEIARKSKAWSEAEAKALHYLVCGGRSGPWHERSSWDSNCDDEDFKRSKRAFRRLHSVYKDSPWTTATPYYYR